MCTVLLRFEPGARWPLLLAAVRDEFVDRPFDPPAAHWPDAAPGVVGGRDRSAGGTWLAVKNRAPAVAAVLNGVHLPPPTNRPRPSRGGLPLSVLSGGAPPDPTALRDYDGFHLLFATPQSVTVWSWDGSALTEVNLDPGDHIVVNRGVDDTADPLVPHFLPLLAQTPTPPLEPDMDTLAAWEKWVDLLAGDGLAGDDPRALIVRRHAKGRAYGSTSAALVAVGPAAVRPRLPPARQRIRRVPSRGAGWTGMDPR